MKDFWCNTEHDLYWVQGMAKVWIDPVESLTVTWEGDPGEEVGTMAKALLVVRMPTPITAFENGDGLLVVRCRCGPRGTGEYNQSDIRLRLERCAVKEKILDSPFTTDSYGEAPIGVALLLSGTLRFW